MLTKETLLRSQVRLTLDENSQNCVALRLQYSATLSLDQNVSGQDGRCVVGVRAALIMFPSPELEAARQHTICFPAHQAVKTLLARCRAYSQGFVCFDVIAASASLLFSFVSRSLSSALVLHNMSPELILGSYYCFISLFDNRKY